MRARRTAIGLSQTDLASAWGIRGRSLIPQIELGRRLPSLDLIRLSVVLFSIDIDYWVLDEIAIDDYERYYRSDIQLGQLAGQSFPAKIRWLREQKGLSERELAKALNVSRSYIYNLEAERLRPSPDVLARIASYFALSVAALLDDSIPLKDA